MKPDELVDAIMLAVTQASRGMSAYSANAIRRDVVALVTLYESTRGFEILDLKAFISALETRLAESQAREYSHCQS